LTPIGAKHLELQVVAARGWSEAKSSKSRLVSGQAGELILEHIKEGV
jgi:hypothetical protein